MTGREIARLLRRLSTASAFGVATASSVGCESVLHWCMNGQYGEPYYSKSVREVPAAEQATFASINANPIEPKTCAALCGAKDVEHCEIASAAERRYIVCFTYNENGCPSGWGSGRVPDGLTLEEEHALDPRHALTLGDYFARAAALEAASVVSFRRLAADLTRHGAPRSLVRRAVKAAREEKRHAALARRLARKWGGVPVRARITPTTSRSLRELAIENAWSGCVGETVGALLLAARADVCAEPDVRAALEEMARDEIAHAALAWDVRAFLLAELDPSAVAAEREALLDAARAASRISFDPVFPFDPQPIVRSLDDHLWHAA